MKKQIWEPAERVKIQALCDEVAGQIVWCEETLHDIEGGYPWQFRGEVLAADPEIGLTIIYKNWNDWHGKPAKCVQPKPSVAMPAYREIMRRVLQECREGWLPIGDSIGFGHLHCPFE